MLQYLAWRQYRGVFSRLECRSLVCCSVVQCVRMVPRLEYLRGKRERKGATHRFNKRKNEAREEASKRASERESARETALGWQPSPWSYIKRQQILCRIWHAGHIQFFFEIVFLIERLFDAKSFLLIQRLFDNAYTLTFQGMYSEEFVHISYNLKCECICTALSAERCRVLNLRSWNLTPVDTCLPCLRDTRCLVHAFGMMLKWNNIQILHLARLAKCMHDNVCTTMYARQH